MIDINLLTALPRHFTPRHLIGRFIFIRKARTIMVQPLIRFNPFCDLARFEPFDEQEEWMCDWSPHAAQRVWSGETCRRMNDTENEAACTQGENFVREEGRSSGRCRNVPARHHDRTRARKRTEGSQVAAH